MDLAYRRQGKFLTELALIAFLAVLTSACYAKRQKASPRFPAVASIACDAICERLFACEVGPWKDAADCRDACAGANEDAVSGKTYACASKAARCAEVRACGRQ